MSLDDIERKVTQTYCDVLMTHKQEDIYKKVLELLVNSIKNNISVSLDEDDVIRINEMYYKIYRQYNLNFLKQIIKYSNNDIDMYKILEKLEIL